VPADHEGRINEACLLCHEAPTAEAAPPALAPSISHSLEGREDCLLCHAVGSQVRPAPDDHAQRDNDTCQTCHQTP
jgi:hypothetical protein